MKLKRSWILGGIIGFLVILGLLYYFYMNNLGLGNVPLDNNATYEDPTYDKNISEDMQKEKDVKYAQAYVSSKQVFATIITNANVPLENIVPITDKYANILSSKYPNKDISVKAVDINGKEISFKEIKNATKKSQ